MIIGFVKWLLKIPSHRCFPVKSDRLRTETRIFRSQDMAGFDVHTKIYNMTECLTCGKEQIDGPPIEELSKFVKYAF